ncbi:putative peptidase S54, rhomboid, Rhomboid-like superfamily [Dioscorea sansibarensis]
MAMAGAGEPRGGGGLGPCYKESLEERKSLFVPAVVVANVVVFAVTMYVNDCPAHRTPFGPCIGVSFLHRFSFQPLRQNPLFGPSAFTLVKLGALEWIKVVRQHQGWRLVTCSWLHAGVLHLLANMLSLTFVGIRIERQFGLVRVGIIYLMSGLGGSSVSSLMIGSDISLGASGALFGVLGAMLSELITNWTIYSNRLSALLTLIFIILINLAIGILPHVDNSAHIGGFFTGFLLGFVLLMKPQIIWVEDHDVPFGSKPKPKYKAYQYILLAIALLLLVSGFVLVFVLLFRGGRLKDYCEWCRYINCVPTSRWTCID